MAIEALGKRIARLRKAAGIRTAADLADRMPDGSNISTAMIQNLESGRKADLSLAQLVLVAKALSVPVASVAVDLRDPFGESGVIGLTNWDVVELLRGTHPPLSTAGTAEYNRIYAIDELLRISQDWERLGPIPLPSSATPEQVDQAQRHYESRQERARARAREAFEVLKAAETVDLGWAIGPWLGENYGEHQAEA